MTIIFLLSNMPYEEQDIKPYLQEKVNLSDIGLPSIDFHYDGTQVSSESDPYGFIEFLFRKAGHVFGYCFLTILFSLTIFQTNIKRIGNYLLSGVLSILYACSDEWHQSFVAGRTGHWEDAIIVDGIGVILAWLILLSFRLKKRKRNSLDGMVRRK